MKNIITIQSCRGNGKVRYGVCGAEERPSKLPRFLRRRRAEQARRQAAMDQYTLGECLHLHYVLGWTAEIRAGHLLFLGRVPEEETEPAAGRRSAWPHLSAGIKKPGGEKGSAGLTCHESTACQKAPCYYSRADRLWQAENHTEWNRSAAADPKLEGIEMKKHEWYRKYRCRSCGAVCDPGELINGLCVDCRDARETVERMEETARAALSSGVRISIREQADGQMMLEVR